MKAACKPALTYTAAPSYKSVKNILVARADKFINEISAANPSSKPHGITRGADYYRR